MDERQASIVFQSSLKVALDLLKHNLPDGQIEAKDVVDLALKLTLVAVNPIPHMNKLTEKGK